MNREIRNFVNLILKVRDPYEFFYGILWQVVNSLTDCVVEFKNGNFNESNSSISEPLREAFKSGIYHPVQLYNKLCEALVVELNERHNIFETFKLLTVLKVLDDQEKLVCKNKNGELIRLTRWYPPVIREYSYNAKNIEFSKRIYSLYETLLSSYGDTSIWDMYYYEDYYFFNMAKDLEYFTLA